MKFVADVSSGFKGTHKLRFAPLEGPTRPFSSGISPQPPAEKQTQNRFLPCSVENIHDCA